MSHDLMQIFIHILETYFEVMYNLSSSKDMTQQSCIIVKHKASNHWRLMVVSSATYHEHDSV